MARQKEKKDAYARAGVDYDDVDPAKVLFLKEALGTVVHAKNLAEYCYEDVRWSRGESVHLIKGPRHYLGFVIEGLGTKNLVVDALQRSVAIGDQCAIAAAVSRVRMPAVRSWEGIGQDVIAMIINDMATLGIAPLVVGMHLAVGDGSWFEDEERCLAYARGFARGCKIAKCAWGCGETPILKGIVAPETAELSGAAYGIARKDEVVRGDVQAGDVILLLASSGIHANGLTLARKIAGTVSGGYLAELEDGALYGPSLLAPTVIYSDLVQELIQTGVKIHYGINITGHGWRKLMRLRTPFTYVIEKVPEPQPIFRFIQKHGKVELREMYANFNMGAGFALILPKKVVNRAKRLAASHGIDVLEAGYVEKPLKDKLRRVVFEQFRMQPFVGAELAIR